MTKKANTFINFELVYCFMSFLSFIIQTKNIAIIGKSKPLAIWEKRITDVGLKFKEEKMIPTAKTNTHIKRNFIDVKLLFQPNSSEVAKAAARGAVIDDERPAAKKPKAINS